MTTTSLSGALARLYALAPRGARHGLDAMREACVREGNPQDTVPSVHVAGTNGKGSVCANVESIARAAGMRVGLYTSPHLLRFSERIRIDGAPIDDALLARTLDRVLDAHPELTFFEVATLAAFLVFLDAKLDLAVLEVGLGGRLDATNVIAKPRATAITTIGLDHTAILGDTLEQIAREKAGIMKPGVPVVIGPLEQPAFGVLHRVAQDVGAPAFDLTEHVEWDRRSDGTTMKFEGRSVNLRPALKGEHQIANAAIAAMLSVLMDISPEIIERGIAETRWPGRLEEIEIESGPLAGRWLLDGAHNEQGARALADALDVRGKPHARRALVFGAMADKPWRTMIDLLASRCVQRVYLEPMASGGGRPAASALEMKAHDAGADVAADAADALRRARESVGREGLVVVAGSLYLVGEARALLLDLPRDPQVGL
jgi:dihydrofolate synthase/folylpolyglutamate synthase